MSEKLILDTDIGSDIDDAVCLAYLLAQPQCRLLGITTVSGEPEKRAMLASVLCKVAGQTVPIYPGAAQPLLIQQQQPSAPQSAALTKWDHDTTFPHGEAIEFLRHTIRAHPGEVTLLTIGPLTNIALLFAMDPEIPSLLKRLVLMCGVYTEHLPKRPTKVEWNARVDPHAAAIVYRAQPPVHRSLGLDVTTQVTMPAATVRKQFQTTLLLPVLDFAEVWFQKADTITFHDPLAAVSLFDDRICDFTRGNIQVELDDQSLLGRTIWQPSATGMHEVALHVDPDRFFGQYFSTLQFWRDSHATL